jgi:hypothetical protein
VPDPEQAEETLMPTTTGMMTASERRAYAKRVRAMSDAEYEEHCVDILDAAARCSVYSTWDDKAQVLADDREHREHGHEIYNRAHRRMVGGIRVEQEIERQSTYIETGTMPVRPGARR